MMNNTFHIISNDEVVLSKFGKQGDLIHYDNKYTFSIFFDTRDATYSNNQLIIKRLSGNYIKFVGVLREYCYSDSNFLSIICEKLQSELLNEKHLNSLILVEFQIENNLLSFPVMRYKIIKCDVVVKFNKSFWNINTVYEYFCKDNKIILEKYWDFDYNSCVKMINFLHKEIGLMKNDCKYVYISMLKWSCKRGYVDIVKYLHRDIKLTIQDVQLYDNCVCLWDCGDGHIDVVKYLHKEIGLSKLDFQLYDNEICKWACEKGNIYLHKEIGLEKQDFQSGNNFPCRCACYGGYVEVVKYLHQDIGLSIQDFQSKNNYACRQACLNKHIDVIEYLHKEIKLTKSDFIKSIMNDLDFFCKKDNIDIVTYLIKEIL